MCKIYITITYKYDISVCYIWMFPTMFFIQCGQKGHNMNFIKKRVLDRGPIIRQQKKYKEDKIQNWPK